MPHTVPTLTLFALIGLLTNAMATESAPAGVPFNGKTTYAQAAGTEAFDLDMFSVAARAKFEETDRSQVLVNRGRPGSLFTLYLYEGRVRMLVEYESGRYTHANAAAPQPNTWVHYLGTYDGETIRLYVDGKLAASQAAAGRIPVSDAPLMIGAAAPGVRVLGGAIDDVCV
ncbi:MAG: LamG domain-containing protein, partial [Patescibacteria group bacterium]|nr:LamG domain-containing protein [Patescibacteria group bacterium]